MSSKQLEAALNLMRRMPPSSIETSLNGLLNLVPDLTDELLQRVDQPLKTVMDSKEQKPFILCDYNRDGDSYRSPWSNQYFPKLDDGFLPSPKLRGVSSVYFWDLDETSSETSFAACWLVQKDAQGVRGLEAGSWNSIHVFEVNLIGNKQFEYKLTTTVIISMTVDNDLVGNINLSGSMTKQSATTTVVDDGTSHVANMGKMVEDMEQLIRNALEGVYIQKTREVLNTMRHSGPEPVQLAALRESLKDAVSLRAAARTVDSES